LVLAISKRHKWLNFLPKERWGTQGTLIKVRRLIMKVLLNVLIVSILFASILVVSGVSPVDLSTVGKNKPALQPVMLPRLSATMPTVPPTALGGNVNKAVMDLSTIGRTLTRPQIPASLIKAGTPITRTPTIAIRNMNITSRASTVYTPPMAIPANATVYTPPFAIFGGA
jgi:hypothetical protein